MQQNSSTMLTLEGCEGGDWTGGVELSVDFWSFWKWITKCNNFSAIQIVIRKCNKKIQVQCLLLKVVKGVTELGGLDCDLIS